MLLTKQLLMKRVKNKTEGISSILVKNLDVDDDLAQTLISNGLDSLESISSAPLKSYLL